MAFDLSLYQPVEDRLREFHAKHPMGRVTTELLSFTVDGDYIVMASLWLGDELRDGRPAATGLAHDSVAQLPNQMKASALETCETSAIGRALANMGFAPKGARPSREEMESKVSGAGKGRSQATGEGASNAPPASDTPSGPEQEPSSTTTRDAPDSGPEPTHDPAWVDSPKLKRFQVCAYPDCVEHQPQRKPVPA